MTHQTRPDKLQKRAAALRENLRRRKPKTADSGKRQAEKRPGTTQKTKEE